MERDCYDDLCHRIRNATTRYGLYSRALHKAIAILPIGRNARAVMIGIAVMIDESIDQIETAINECAKQRRQQRREPE